MAEPLQAVHPALAGAGERSGRGELRERSAYLSDPTEVWIQRAMEEVMARRPEVGLGSADVVPLRDYLSERWVGAQIRYHEGSARRQGAWDSRLFAATGVLFLITAVAAFLHLLGWGEHHGEASQFGLLLIEQFCFNESAESPIHASLYNQSH